jgi:hypothetical protein
MRSRSILPPTAEAFLGIAIAGLAALTLALLIVAFA